MPAYAIAWPLTASDDTNSNFSRLSANGTIRVLNAPVCLEAFTEVTFYIQVESVTGAPTTWTLAMAPEFLIPHTTGDQFSTPNGPIWTAFDSTQAAGLTYEGESWPTWTQATGIPARAKRTYRGFGWGMGIAVTLSNLTGGTSPSVNITATMVAKG